MPYPRRRAPAFGSLRPGARPALAIVAFVALAGAACGPIPPRTPTNVASLSTNAEGKFGARVTRLQIIEIVAGTGAEALPGMFVVVHYTGWLYDPAAADGRGAKVDSTADRNAAFGFYLDTGKVIKGWDEGMAGMRIGGKRTLVVPPDMAYGARGGDGIPPDAALVFEVELVDTRISRSQPTQ